MEEYKTLEIIVQRDKGRCGLTRSTDPILHVQKVDEPLALRLFHQLHRCLGSHYICIVDHPSFRLERSEINDRQDFLFKVAVALTKPQIEQRSTHSLQKGTLSAIAHYFGDRQVGASASPIAEKREKNRCRVCPHKRAPKQRQSCNRYKNGVRSEHSAKKSICKNSQKVVWNETTLVKNYYVSFSCVCKFYFSMISESRMATMTLQLLRNASKLIKK